MNPQRASRATPSEFPAARPFDARSGAKLPQVVVSRYPQVAYRLRRTAVMNFAVSAPISDDFAPQGIKLSVSRCSAQFLICGATALSAQPFLWRRNAHFAETSAKLLLPKSPSEPPFFSAGCAQSDARQATVYITLAENSFS